MTDASAPLPVARAHVALLVDVESLLRATPAVEVATLAPALVRYAEGVGRVTLARAYGDFVAAATDPVGAAAALEAARIAPVLVTRGPAGEDRAHVRLAVDAMEARLAGGEPDAFVLATADERLLALVHFLRADGCEVLCVVPEGLACEGLQGACDVVVRVADVLAGAVGPACLPAGLTHDADDDDRAGDAAPPVAPPVAPSAPVVAAAARLSAYAPPAATVPPRAPFPRRAPYEAPRDRFGRPDFPRRDPAFRDAGRPRAFGPDRPFERGRFAGGRDDRGGFGPGRGDRTRGPAGPSGGRAGWSAFVQLMDALEQRLPFVGVRYLVQRVLGPHNVGVFEPHEKRDLLQRAQDEGIVEVFEVPNLEGKGDPVTACRLRRDHPAVTGQLGPGTKAPDPRPPRPARPAPRAEASRAPDEVESPGDGGPPSSSAEAPDLVDAAVPPPADGDERDV